MWYLSLYLYFLNLGGVRKFVDKTCAVIKSFDGVGPLGSWVFQTNLLSSKFAEIRQNLSYLDTFSYMHIAHSASLFRIIIFCLSLVCSLKPHNCWSEFGYAEGKKQQTKVEQICFGTGWWVPGGWTKITKVCMGRLRTCNPPPPGDAYAFC